MLLEALQDIPGCIPIAPGQVFREPDPERAQTWIASGMARVPDRRYKNGSSMVEWPGADVAILASGPSLSVEQADAVKVWRDAAPQARRVIAINTTFRRAPWADMLYACDGAWWKIYADEVARKFPGERWTQDTGAATTYGLRLMKSRRALGLSLEPGLVNQGESSGYQAIGIAYQAKARRALLLGFDNRGCHWHGPHPGGLNKKNIFASWSKNYVALARECTAAKFEVVNCTPNSALKSFPFKNWTEEFRAGHLSDS